MRQKLFRTSDANAIEEHTWLFLASAMIVLRVPGYLVIGFRDRYNGLGMHLITG